MCVKVCPGCGGESEYVLTSPLFDKTSLKVGPDASATFIIHAVKSSVQDIYIQSASLNGKDYDCAFIAHKDIVAGGDLVFVMGPKPNTSWASRGRACLNKDER